jgi:hypothetical protein
MLSLEKSECYNRGMHIARQRMKRGEFSRIETGVQYNQTPKKYGKVLME